METIDETEKEKQNRRREREGKGFYFISYGVTETKSDGRPPAPVMEKTTKSWLQADRQV